MVLNEVSDLANSFFINVYTQTSVVGVLGSFYEAFYSVHIDIGIISYRPKLRNIS